MSRWIRRCVCVAAASGLILLSAGCAKENEVVPLTIPERTGSLIGSTKALQGMRVGVKPFEDRRHEPSLLGMKSGRFGSLDSYNFVVSGADVGQAVADGLVQYLAEHGAEAETVRIGAPPQTDVMISGEIIDLSADANPGWWSTRVTAKASLLIESENRADGARARITAGASDARSVGWFRPAHAQSLLNQVLLESFAKWKASVKVDGKSIQPK